MLNKNEVIKELSNEEFIVRNAVYEYVCNLHLYDDKQINEAFIKFIENNYNQINFAGLKYSKLNEDIIECLINISLKEESEFIRESISSVFIKHYNLIKDMKYNFEEIIDDEENLLMYKKIKHFSKKDPIQLIELYKNNINEYYFADNERYITEVLRMAMGTALIQTEEGYNRLMNYICELIEPMEEGGEEFIFEHMPYLVYPLCQYSDLSHHLMVLDLYLLNMDFIGYAEECNHYFSNICNEKFVNNYIKTLKSFNKVDLEDYYYDISEYLNSDEIDIFLFNELKRNKDKCIKENIIRILANKFDRNVIPYALEFLKKDKFDDEEGLKEAIAPLLILAKCDDDISKKVIQEVKDYEFEDVKTEMVSNLLNGMQNLLLKNKPHIKEYKKIRKLHNEVMESMMKYLQQGKFELKIDNNIENIAKNGICYINSKFDTSTELGIQAMANAIVYKNACNINCITEEFIKKNRYRTQEKIELLESMLNSEAGLFEIIETDRKNGQIHLKNVLNNKEYCITDIGFSSNIHNDKIYLYTRIITYHGISFGTGLNLAFDKNDKFICKWIKENSKDIDKKQEISRFMELYNEYERNDKGIKVLSKNV
ncbi:MAG: hypothetical protein HFJ40_06875 [Clostridia bacterium]|nr:hypothetical protein [Clostridia bacterium]